ncbi:MAG: tRNA pseudouridine(38-40) synthase TruA [Alphaproteobacteria bacterium]|nr:tRNA pseudouridine(38-40) synthase TruA [Alphaproteobacteria bacterium]
MPRYKITIEYDGTNYSGWQRQEKDPSIQEEIEKAAVNFLHHEITLTGAGRTDAGVHALGQVASFDTDKEFTNFALCSAFNAWLKPQPIVVIDAQKVDDDFSARFSAIERSYIYKILNRKFRPALMENRCWHVPQELDVDAMRDSAQIFLGKHDFTSFRAAACQAKSPIRTLDEFTITKENDMILFHLRAKSFLHHQVRNLVGTLKLVGEHTWTKQDVQNALDAKDRKAAGPTAPACGLYFEKVLY